MTKEQEILETYCTFAGMIYSKYQVDAYGIKPTPPNYNEATLEELKLKSDKIKNNFVDYLKEPAFEFEQITAENVWIIEHELEYDPKVISVDYENKLIEGTILYSITGNTLLLTFSLPVCGKAFLY